MKTSPLVAYHHDERIEAISILVIGALCLLFAFLLYTVVPTGFAQGWGISLGAISLGQLLIGSNLLRENDRNKRIRIPAYSENPPRFKAKELPQAELTMRNFEKHKHVILALLMLSVLGLVMTDYEGFAAGIAIGLLLQLILMLIHNIVSRIRVEEYLEWLKGQSSS